MGDYFRDTKEFRESESKKRKERNLNGSTRMLEKNGFDFEEKNGGVHLVVKHNGKIADFWPTTGKFCIRGTNQYKRGVRLLIKLMRED